MRKILLLGFFCLAAAYMRGDDASILDFGAAQDAANNAKAIQSAIDHCAATGGGTVHVLPGVYQTSTVFLKDNVHLYLHGGSTLRAVPDPQAYSRDSRAVVVAQNAENVSVRGEGCIDGQGNHANFQFGDEKGNRPHVILFDRCRNVQVKDVFLYNSASWTLRCAASDGIRISGVKIYSHGNYNCDGIDVNSRNVTISDCLIDCDDDGICFKTEIPGFDVEHVTVSNCVIASNCNGIKFGTGSFHAFRNISISNCVIRKASENNIRSWRKMLRGITADTTVISGIALEVVDGGVMDRVAISNISMQDVQTPSFIRLGNRRGSGTLKNVLISNVVAQSESLITSSITGIPGSYVENVTLRDIFLSNAGGANEEDARMEVPEKVNQYPENRMFGPVLPAYGFYVRHVENLTMENIQCEVRHEDARPAFVFDDVHRVSLSNFQADVPRGGSPVVRLVNASDVSLSGFRAGEETVPLFIKVEGGTSRGIHASDNDFIRVSKKAELDKAVKKSEVIL